MLSPTRRLTGGSWAIICPNSPAQAAPVVTRGDLLPGTEEHARQPATRTPGARMRDKRLGQTRWSGAGTRPLPIRYPDGDWQGSTLGVGRLQTGTRVGDGAVRPGVSWPGTPDSGTSVLPPSKGDLDRVLPIPTAGRKNEADQQPEDLKSCPSHNRPLLDEFRWSQRPSRRPPSARGAAVLRCCVISRTRSCLPQPQDRQLCPTGPKIARARS